MENLKDERCPYCGKLLGRIRGSAELKCPRCKAIVNIDNAKQINKRVAPNINK